jgi:hypothetical protein
VANATEEQFRTIELRFTSIKSGAETQMAQHEKTKVKATSTTKVMVDERPEDDPTVLSARLISEAARQSPMRRIGRCH